MEDIDKEEIYNGIVKGAIVTIGTRGISGLAVDWFVNHRAYPITKENIGVMPNDLKDQLTILGVHELSHQKLVLLICERGQIYARSISKYGHIRNHTRIKIISTSFKGKSKFGWKIK